ncbi:hypothetical protein J2Z69_002773 [Paenibacillus shirakamiensis]|uniref:Transglutaminase-like domain-containing protein n=1 Tax=Paenibacillus shirakamiensis TaxID=1265935 RepID=A0ABS4JJ52_9BACL|nr:transglutaminase-like domain-containing protein [Paenibacillus shirakamiensis]MBP2001728.1 hypothetical protein [Paenibacillus shirakamiensis]
MQKILNKIHRSSPSLQIMNAKDLPEPKMKYLDRMLLSLFLFGLFREWLAPLIPILGPDDSRTIALFYVITLSFLVLGCMDLPRWMYMCLSPAIWITSMLYIFGQSQGLSWFMHCGQVITENVQQIYATGRMLNMGEEMRMLLLLMGWSLLVISVQLLALSRQSIFLFFGATILYLLALEYGLNLSVYAGVVRTVLIGLLLQAVIHVLHLRQNVQGDLSGLLLSRYMWSVALILGCVFGIAGLTRQLDSKPSSSLLWNHAVQSLETWTETSLLPKSRSTYNLSGYGEDDQELGAPLQLKHEPFLTVNSPIRSYLRGESKSKYTGRGWEEGDIQQILLAEDGTIPKQISNLSHGPLIQQTITFHEPQTGELALWGGGIPIKLDRLQHGNQSLPFQSAYYDISKEAVLYKENPMDTTHNSQLTGYSITVEAGDVPSTQLQAIPLTTQDPSFVKENNLALPAELPASVKNLAKQIIKDAPTRYEAVMAVQTYLKQHYKYTLKTSIPPTGDDFTAHFLFVAKKGYCTHFSTAMAVLLRTQGIPARWVKGFAPGQLSKEDKDRYNVSYADAHAWVEVYFPEFGWVPFDPTPGFSMTSDEAPLVSSALANVGGLNYIHVGSRVLKLSVASLNKFTFQLLLWIQQHRGSFILIIISFIALVSLFGWVLSRWTWMVVLLIFYLPRNRFPGRPELLKVSEKVWTIIYRRYGNQTVGITGREYISSLGSEDDYERTELIQFLNTWEAVYYGRVKLDRLSTRMFLRKCRHITTIYS